MVPEGVIRKNRGEREERKKKRILLPWYHKGVIRFIVKYHSLSLTTI